MVHLVLQPDARPGPYLLAGKSVLIRPELPLLAPLAQRQVPTTGAPPAPVPPAGPTPHARMTYDGPGWVAEAWRAVACQVDEGGTWVDMADAGAWWVAPDGSAAVLRAETPLDEASLTAALCGPPLHLALAAGGTYCLHAGAVARAGQVVAFMGESGAGKSSLARHLAGADTGWTRLADDGLPLLVAGDAVQARADYPQLKLPPASWPAVPHVAPRLAAVCELDVPSDPATPVALTPLAPAAATLALVRHTVAGRLLGGAAAERHLAWCADVAQRVPVWRLTYPHRATAIAEVAAGSQDLLMAPDPHPGRATTNRR